MQQYRNFEPLDVAPANWSDALHRALSVAAEQFVLRIKPSDATVLEVPASVNAGAAVVWIEGNPRWIEANVEFASLGGGTARNMDVWVVSTANVFTPGSPGEVDSTNYAFTLVIKETGVAPTGVAIKRQVGTAHWTGTVFDTVTPTVGRPSPQTIGVAELLRRGLFSAYRSAAMAIAAGVIIQFDVEEFDVSGWFNTANGSYTPLVAGYYRMNWMVSGFTSAADGYFQTALIKNGELLKTGPFGWSGNSGSGMGSGATAVVLANGSTESFGIQVQQHAGNFNIAGGLSQTYFQAELIAAT